MLWKCYKKLHATSKFEVPEVSNEGPTNIRCHNATFSRPDEVAPAIWASLFLWPILTLSELTQAEMVRASNTQAFN